MCSPCPPAAALQSVLVYKGPSQKPECFNGNNYGGPGGTFADRFQNTRNFGRPDGTSVDCPNKKRNFGGPSGAFENCPNNKRNPGRLGGTSADFSNNRRNFGGPSGAGCSNNKKNLARPDEATAAQTPKKKKRIPRCMPGTRRRIDKRVYRNGQFMCLSYAGHIPGEMYVYGRTIATANTYAKKRLCQYTPYEFVGVDGCCSFCTYP